MSQKKKPIIAICYDFDGTLAYGNMQEHNFIPNRLKIDKNDFWKEVEKNAKENDMDGILSYMELTLEKSRKEQIKFNEDSFKEDGKSIKFFDGLVTENNWFERMKKYTANKEIDLEHYIISSGLKPIIEGTPIEKYFKYIFACQFKYDIHGVAVFPSVAINYTTKTQYLFRVNKGILNNWDSSVNQPTPEEEIRIPFRNMIYIGDGLTDVPAMKMINYKGGYSVGVYDKEEKKAKQVCEDLLTEKRCSYIAEANFTETSNLDKIAKLLIDKIYAENQLLHFKNL